MRFREGLVKIFPEFYNQGDGENSGRIGASQEEIFAQKWGWFTAFVRLSDGNFLEIERATKLSIQQALTYLTYMIDEQKLIASKQKSR